MLNLKASHFSSKQLLLHAFAWQCIYIMIHVEVEINSLIDLLHLYILHTVNPLRPASDDQADGGKPQKTYKEILKNNRFSNFSQNI